MGYPIEFELTTAARSANHSKMFCEVGGVEVQRTGIEAHSSLNPGERYHEPSRKTFRKLMAAYTKSDKNLTLALSIKAIHDSLDQDVFVPSLIFGK